MLAAVTSVGGTAAVGFVMVLVGAVSFIGAMKPTVDGVFTQRHTNLGRAMSAPLAWAGAALIIGAGLVATVL